MELLKLVALDAEDLAVVSAHLQDAVLRVGDIAYLAAEHRFALAARRFDWRRRTSAPRRRLTGLHFERVLRGPHPRHRPGPTRRRASSCSRSPSSRRRRPRAPSP